MRFGVRDQLDRSIDDVFHRHRLTGRQASIDRRVDVQQLVARFEAGRQAALPSDIVASYDSSSSVCRSFSHGPPYRGTHTMGWRSYFSRQLLSTTNCADVQPV
jgi:hypothetical protein